MAGKFMTVKPSVCIPTMHRSNNQIIFKHNSKLLSFPLSGLHYDAGSSRVFHTTRQNTTSASLHCRSTKAENLAETSSFGFLTGGDFGVRKQFFLNLQAEWFNSMLFPLELMKYALSAISKSVLLGFVSLLHLKSLKTEPMNVYFNDLISVDDIILEFQDIISILHGKSEYKNFRAKLPIGVFLYGPPGTGKGTLAHAMAREANVPFFCISACYIRTGDVRIKSLFDEARRCSPSIIFIDYVDEIASQRENCDSDPNLVEFLFFHDIIASHRDGEVQ
ncbi:ATPase, AAA-type, core, P-loop containing nucleoside triphosphate hydrolase [Artemisia annua]|uniref:ATPase, AAA-type, core, P-loop containing nucleoside triphosphate hydrolase n=1 Tax=Artemisia annua TaxID=35608 RepID=A0A2U1LJS4_ARTAN|nr:ATPase, AAA-type, core, P-loop containing nucleoside triphosphate hydrolase [Artemisia annua]